MACAAEKHLMHCCIMKQCLHPQHGTLWQRLWTSALLLEAASRGVLAGLKTGG